MLEGNGDQHAGRAGWLPWKDSTGKSVIYHCVTRVVERRKAYGAEETEESSTPLQDLEQVVGMIRPQRHLLRAGMRVNNSLCLFLCPRVFLSRSK